MVRFKRLFLSVFACFVLGCLAARMVIAGMRGTVVGTSEGVIALSVAPPSGEIVAGSGVVRLLSESLERSGHFRLVPFDGAPPSDPSRVRGPLVPTGASFLVATSVLPVDDALRLSAYVVPAGAGTAVFAREYRTTSEQLPEAAFRLADDVVRELTGHPGFALSRIAYVAQQGRYPAIFAARPDGSGSVRLVSGDFPAIFPRFARDRHWILYTAYPRGFPELFVRDVASGRNHAISSRAGLNTLAALSPDGTSVAATLSFEGNPELYVLTLTGSMRHRLTHDRGCDFSPTWSPDGERIAFVSDRTGLPQIWVVEADGSGAPRQLTYPFSAARYCTSPSWSPRGDHVVFSGRVDGVFDLFLVDVSTGDVQRLTEGVPHEEDPDWAPDGRHVVAATRQGDRSGLVILDTRDPSRRISVPLPEEHERVRSPSWSPGGR